ncbi:hypothetical protein LINGRAPRIM_LOCUS1545, partial [Linum grandiflorum]
LIPCRESCEIFFTAISAFEEFEELEISVGESLRTVLFFPIFMEFFVSLPCEVDSRCN